MRDPRQSPLGIAKVRGERRAKRRRRPGVGEALLDVEALAAFYVGIFRLDELDRQTDEQGVRSIWLSLGDAILMIERRLDGEPEPNPTSRDCLLYTSPSPRD